MLESQRLFLQTACWPDWQASLHLNRLPEPPEFQDYPTPDDSQAWTETKFRECLQPGHYEIFSIYLKSMRLLGFVKAFDFQSATQSCECGIQIFDPADYGQGYASEAMLLWLQYLSQYQHLQTVCGLIHPQNQRSLRLFQKLGFVYNGQVKDPLEDWVFESLVFYFVR